MADGVSIDDLMAALKRPPRGDRPRLVVFCSPDDYPEIQRGVTEIATDVLVKSSQYIESGRCYVADGRLVESIMAPPKMMLSDFCNEP